MSGYYAKMPDVPFSWTDTRGITPILAELSYADGEHVAYAVLTTGERVPLGKAALENLIERAREILDHMP